jgi:hypothetical protein
MAFEPCQNCISSSSDKLTYLRFDCGMPILTSGTDTILTSSNLTLRNWALELSKHSLSNMKLNSNTEQLLNFEHSVVFIKTNGPIRIKGYLPAMQVPVYDLTIVDAAFINFGQKYDKIILMNEQTSEYEITLLTGLSKGLI